MRRKLFDFREGLSDIYYIWRTEFLSIFKDRGVIILFFLVPLLYPLLYAYLYNEEVVYESKMVIVDQDNSDLSRAYIRMIDASAGVQVVGVTTNVNEARQSLWNKEAYAIARIPKGFRKDIYQGKQTRVTFFSDLSSVLYYKNFMLTLNQAALDLGRAYRLNHDIDKTGQPALIQVQPVVNEDVSFFNPAGGYASFLLPVILILIIQQTMVMGVSMLAATKRERSLHRELIPLISDRHYRGPMRIVFGKSVAYIMVYAVVCVWVLLAVPAIFDLPRMAHLGELALFILPFLLACVFFSLFVSCFIFNREDSMLLIAFTSVIFVFLSGVTWPETAMPEIWRWVSFLIPSTPGARGMVALNTMGGGLEVVSNYHTILWMQAGGYLLFSSLGYAYLLRKQEKKLKDLDREI
ncbi:hypothetical protein HQ45_06680 [Porphyromonas crevioricanis]|uniref:ABC-2 family transporter protein n=1 Tax=Porphyromonas crevioricanis TaxID=393921 RepID=A0A0A2FHZ4_9PORP|nr:ABC transporter permease [Porphyromonas crevioricanis]KGN89675.1 hypothetical protein HQ45_06680 [Porphyromonas crevioricanis]KGN93770.1 hypothetical protein HQ38_08340 [Porphyromonas crevioricanis]GAD07938.1 ABC-type multidrug transport system, permease component [Porphyromonas crevioricanis JCM 13913]SQH72391.1 ABC-2 family transporter protein [Porphyromonas crevioricanis]